MAKVTEVIQGIDAKPDTEIQDPVVKTEVVDEVEISEQEDKSVQEQPELVVTIGDEKPEPEDENLNFKQVRDRARQLAKDLRETKRQLAAVAGSKVDELGQKPTLESFQYDTEKYEAAHEQWLLKKQAVDAEARRKEDEKNQQTLAWQAKMDGYGKAKVDFKTKAPDFDDAELAVQESLNQTQQGIILECAKDAPLLVYALHKNPAKLKELAAITNPVVFTWQLAYLEAQLKVTTKNQPEERVSGVVATGRGGDQHLIKLQAEAARTGDITKVVAYKRQVRAKAQAA